MPTFAEVLERDSRIYDRRTHRALKYYLIDHMKKVWATIDYSRDLIHVLLNMFYILLNIVS